MGVLVSGRGSNLAALIAAAEAPDYPASVVAAASNRSACPALSLARAAGIAARTFPAREFGGDAEARDRALAAWLLERQVEILVLAGYDRILSESLVGAFPGRILNLHNSLLPAFAGTMNAVEQALDHGVKLTGCTVHIVDSDAVDGGPIVLQAAVAVEDEDTPASLLQRIHEQEWRILPQAVALLASDGILVEGRRVRRRPC